MTSPFERVQTKTGNLHVRDRVRGVEGGQLHFETRRVCRLDARQAAGLKELAQAFVPERCDHAAMIARCATRNKGGDAGGGRFNFGIGRRPRLVGAGGFMDIDGLTSLVQATFGGVTK